MNVKIVKLFSFGLMLTLLMGEIGTASAFSDSGGEDWGFYREITISENSGETLTDYQVLIELNGENFPVKAKRDGSDLRFEDSYGKELNYWIEEWDVRAKEAKIWVKVPSIPANEDVKINMWYLNLRARAVSDGVATFEFFDDFEDGDYTSNPSWTVISGEGNWDASNKYLETPNIDADNSIKSDVSYVNNGSYEWQFKTAIKNWDMTSQGREVRFMYLNERNYAEVNISGQHFLNTGFRDGGRTHEANYGGYSSDLHFYFTDKNWHSYRIMKNKNNWMYYEDGSYVGGVNKAVNFNPDAFFLRGWSNRGTKTGYKWDDIRIRNYTYPEPTIIMGVEKISNPQITAYNLIGSVSADIDELKQKNVVISPIEEVLNNARVAYNSERYDEAIEFAEDAKKMLILFTEYYRAILNLLNMRLM